MSAAKKIPESFITDLKPATHPSLRITQQLYDCDRDNIIFLLSDNNGNTFERTAAEVALNNMMIEALPSYDVLLIGYVAGMEHSEINRAH